LRAAIGKQHTGHFMLWLITATAVKLIHSWELQVLHRILLNHHRTVTCVSSNNWKIWQQ